MQQAIFNKFFFKHSLNRYIEEPKTVKKEATQIKDLLLTDDYFIIKKRTEVTRELPAI